MSGGAWSEVSYTTSDDGMLRMCHTSLAPSKPRRWTKGDNLGEGSYGSVWLALNGDTGELFALKEVRVGSSDKHRDESIEQLEQEVEVLSRLVHPNIVRYIGITREETALYIFLEYVPGGSIASLVQRFGKFEENVIRVYTRQILIGLAYLHSQRVVHRDIKGTNILVEKSGRIKLADFGMAKVLEARYGAGTANAGSRSKLREFDQATRVLLKLLQKGVMTGDFGMRQELTNVRLFFFYSDNLLPSLFCSLCFFVSYDVLLLISGCSLTILWFLLTHFIH